MAKKSDIDRAMEILDEQIRTLQQAKIALLAACDAKPKRVSRKPNVKTGPVAS